MLIQIAGYVRRVHTANTTKISSLESKMVRLERPRLELVLQLDRVNYIKQDAEISYF